MNGKMKGILAAVYIILIALLLMTNCRGCNEEQTTEQPPYEEPTTPSEEEAEEIARNIGNDGEIKITMLWDFPGDVDLHVAQPNGNELYFQNMTDAATGGRLDVDNRRGGRGSAENIYWTNPMHGQYEVSVVMYRLDPLAWNGGPVTVVVKHNNQTETFRVRLNRLGQNEHVYTFNY